MRSHVDVNVTSVTFCGVNIGGMLQTKNAPPGNDESNFGIFYQAMRIPPFVHPPYMPMEKYQESLPKRSLAWATQRGYEKMNHSKIEALIQWNRI